MKKLYLVLFISILSYTTFSQETPEKVKETPKEENFTRSQVDSLLQSIRDYFDELLDVEIGYAALQARHISNVGYGIDNKFGLNEELRDTLEFLRDVVESEVFVKSMLKYDHFWPNLINRKNYSPKEGELGRQHDELYSKQLFFDVVFYPAWDTVNMDPDAARKANKIAYICEIKVNGLGKFSAELSEEEMTGAMNSLLTGNEYQKVKRDAAPAVNQGMFAGVGWLIDKFGFVPFKDPTNIKRVDFLAPVAQKYGYDGFDNPILANNYDNISVKGKQYYVPWKSANVSDGETIMAVVKLKEKGKSSGDTIKFTTTTGLPVSVLEHIDDTIYKIQLPALGSETEIGLLATYGYADSTGKEVIVNAGQANISGYVTQSMELVVVPVNGNGNNINIQELQDNLNKVYRQAATTWSINIDKTLDATSIYSGGGLDDSESGAFTNYSDGMNALIDLYKDQPGVDIDKNTCYLFIVDKAASGTGKCGYMPLKKQFGFIFEESLCANNLERTIAHELGHGPFRLYHTFSEGNEYTQTQGGTRNLMDYPEELRGEATSLNKYQWDLVHNPEAMVALFNDDKEGAAEVDLIDDLSLGNYAGHEDILQYMLRDGLEDLLYELETYRYLDVVDNDNLSEEEYSQILKDAENIIKNVLGNVIIGDITEAYFLIEEFRLIYEYKQVASIHEQIIELILTNDFFPEKDIVKIITQALGYGASGTTGQNKFAEIYKEIWNARKGIDKIEIDDFRNKLIASINGSKKTSVKITERGMRVALSKMSNSQIKKLYKAKLYGKSPKKIARIIHNRRNGIHNYDDLIKVLDAADKRYIVGTIDDITLASMRTPQNFNVPSKTAKIMSVSGNVLSMLQLINFVKNDVDISPTDVISFIPHPIGLMSIVVDLIVEDAVKAVNATFYDVAPRWNMVRSWNSLYKGNSGLPVESLYICYTDQKGKFNSSILPTSIVFLNKDDARMVLKFEPTVADFDLKSKVRKDENNPYFKPYKQVDIEWQPKIHIGIPSVK